MEFADGGDLYQKILSQKKKNQRFDQNEIWSVLIQVTRGLKALHDLKIFHRDLKVKMCFIQSANVFLTKDGKAKLGDLNVSKIAKNGLLYTQTGTPYYASPQVWKDKPYDTKSDIWSFGCVIYEMATFEPPFKAQDMEGLYTSVTKGVYPPVPEFYSKELISVIRLMLQQNPTNRPSCDKLLKSALLIKKSKQLKLDVQSEISTELLKTIKIPKKLHNLSDILPKSNYEPMRGSQKAFHKRSTSERNQQNRPRQSTVCSYEDTMPKAQNETRYEEQSHLIRRQSQSKRHKNVSALDSELRKINYSYDMKEKNIKDKMEIKEYLKNMKGKVYQNIIMSALPPLKR